MTMTFGLVDSAARLSPQKEKSRKTGRRNFMGRQSVNRAFALVLSARRAYAFRMSPLLRSGLLVFLLLSASARAAENARPNILFLFADDWGRHAGVYAAIDGRPS